MTFFETWIFTCVMWTYPKSALTPISCVQTVAYSVQNHKPWECQNLMQVSFKWLIEPHEIGVWHLQRAKTILYSWERKSKKLDPPITPISLAGSICSWGSRNKPAETTSHAVDPSSKSKVCSILFLKKKHPSQVFDQIPDGFTELQDVIPVKVRSFWAQQQNLGHEKFTNWDPNSIMSWRTAGGIPTLKNDGLRHLGLWTCQYPLVN